MIKCIRLGYSTGTSDKETIWSNTMECTNGYGIWYEKVEE